MPQVVVTGLGTYSSIADDYESLKKALQSGHHKIKPVTLFETNSVHPAGEINKVEICSRFPYRTHALSLKALEEALERSKCLEHIAPHRIGLCFGSCTLGMLEMEETLVYEKKISGFSSYDALEVGEFTEQLAAHCKIKGPIFSFSTACSSSSNAICHAFFLVKNSICDAIIVGSADSLCRLTYHGFQSLKVMSELPCQPFDLNRTGMNLGEGAGFLVLESWENAQKRGAKMYAELIGVGMSADAYHMTTPDPNGEGAYLAMKKALDFAEISHEEIEYISAHGTATQQNDRAESIAIDRLLKNHSKNVFLTATKSYLGHTLGSSGILAAICALSSFSTKFIPPTLRLRKPDPLFQIKHPPLEGVSFSPEVVLINAFAFGGNNTSLIFRKYHDK